LLMDRDEMSTLYRGPSIDGSYLVSVHLAEGRPDPLANVAATGNSCF
jgi:hypothetical protein